jgi:thermostable 8-oxoguanine DNA glycosylase
MSKNSIIDRKNRDQKIVKLAYKFLLSFDQIDKNTIDTQLEEVDNKSIDSLDDVFFRFAESLQNANMKANVIGKSINGIENIKRVILPLSSMERFKDEKELLREIFDKLKPTSKMTIDEHIQRSTKSLWYKYAKSLMEVRVFLNQFQDVEDFKSWVEFFDNDERSRAALPMILSNEIYGIGFALACDALKELGYLNFGKPDVHLKEIFYELGLSDSKKDYMVLKAIVRVSKNYSAIGRDIKPYHIDKLFWLIGSGKFYLFEGKDIGRQRDRFISYVKENI